MNQLEPGRLLEQFQAHPPEGFGVATSVHGVPVFTTRFDLLTTAEQGLQRRVRALPGYRHWSALLRPQTCFVGSTVSEYALFPRGCEAGQLASELVSAHATMQPFLIVKDLPRHSPLLGAEENAWADAFAQACVRHGFVDMQGQALAWVPINFADEQTYLSRLSRGARRDIRRKLRCRSQLDIEAIPTGSAIFEQAGERERFRALFDNVFEQSEIHFDRLTPGFLDGVLRDARSGGMVFVYRHRGEMIGWNLCFEHAGMLVDKYVGFAYPQARDLNLYAVSWMHNLEYARTRGLSHYVAGWTDPEIKLHLGARLTFTRHLVRPRSRVLRMALRRLAGHFESDRRWFEEHGDATSHT